MNKKDLAREAAALLRDRGSRKSVSVPKQIFYISDDDGNTRQFSVKKKDRNVVYTIDDVESILDALIDVTMDALRTGDNVSIRGFGSLALQHRKARSTVHPDTGEPIIIQARYVPKFSFGADLRTCARVYEAHLKESKALANSKADIRQHLSGREMVGEKRARVPKIDAASVRPDERLEEACCEEEGWGD